MFFTFFFFFVYKFHKFYLDFIKFFYFLCIKKIIFIFLDNLILVIKLETKLLHCVKYKFML